MLIRFFSSDPWLRIAVLFRLAWFWFGYELAGLSSRFSVLYAFALGLFFFTAGLRTGVLLILILL